MKCKECKGTGQDNKEYTIDDLTDEIIIQMKKDNMPKTSEGIADSTITILSDKIVQLTNRVQEIENDRNTNQ